MLRRVTSTASVSLTGNRSRVDAALLGRRVELRFAPEDLTRLEVSWAGHPAGQASPFILGRHVHHQVPQAQPPTPPPSTGVDYLGLVLAAPDAEPLGQLAFRDLPVQPPENGQPEEDRIEDHQVEQPNENQPAGEHKPEEDHQPEDQSNNDHDAVERQPEEDQQA